MNDVLHAHDRILRTAIDTNAGAIFSTAGDAFGAAFHTAEAALRTAVSVQRELSLGEWPEGLEPHVRMGLHTGSSFERDNSYFGPTLNRAARLMDAAHGGQVVVSGDLQQELTDLPTGVSLVDLGSFLLPDIGEPVSIWQVVIDGLRSGFPPLDTLGPPPPRVPIYHTSFIDRTDELARLKAALAQRNLVTLVAAGGTGKTRLAYKTAVEVADGFPDGVFAIELADGGADQVEKRAAEAVLGEVPLARTERASDPLGALIDHLAARRAILVVDNCEHVMQPARRLIGRITEACPRTAILATSREVFGIAGEMVLQLRPLAHSEKDGAPPPAVELFLERAATANADPRTSPRQRSLDGAIWWSWNLLDPAEQLLLAQTSAFVGGFGLDAVQTIGGGTQGLEVVDQLESLVDKSLVTHEGKGRYRLAEPIRRFAITRLDDLGRTDETHASHFDHFSRLARSVVPELDTRPEPSLVGALAKDHDNFIAAIERSRDRGDVASASKLATRLHTYWEETGHLTVGSQMLESVIGDTPDDPAVFGAVALRTTYASMCGDLDRAQELAAPMRTALEANLPDEIAGSLRFNIGFIDLAVGRLEECIDLWSTAGAQLAERNKPLARQSDWSAGYATTMAGDLARARELFDLAEAVPLSGEGWFAPMLELNRIVCDVVEGRRDVAAIELCFDAVDRLGLRLRTLLGSVIASFALFTAGRPERAERIWRRGLEMVREGGQIWGAWLILEFAAWGACESGDHERAARFWGALHAFGTSRGYARWTLIEEGSTARRDVSLSHDPGELREVFRGRDEDGAPRGRGRCARALGVALHRRTATSDVRCLFERVCDLQHTEVVAVAPDDLHSDREPVGREPRRHGDRRTGRDRDVVRRLHPRDVVLHLYAVDLFGPVRRRVERRHLVHRADEELIGLLELTDAVEQLALRGHRGVDVGAREAEPGFDLPDGFGLQLIAMPVVQRTKPARDHPRAKRAEDFVRAAEVRAGVLDDAAERFEGRTLRVEDLTDAGIEREPIEIRTPCDARS